MTTFKTFLKVLNKCKVPVIIYTVILLFFGGMNMQTSESSLSFTATKPKVLLINNDDNTGITKNLTNYIKKKAELLKIKNDEDAIKDSLFYRDVSCIITIPNGYREDFLKGENPKVDFNFSDNYEASLMKMDLEQYLKVASTYRGIYSEEKEMITKINETLKDETKVEIASKLDSGVLGKASYYYNFLSYSVLAGIIYVICLVLASFNAEPIRKRTVVSSENYKRHNRIILGANVLFAIFLWFLYVLVSFIVCRGAMTSLHGLIFALNSLIFTVSSVTVALLISSLNNNQEAINGIVNVVALGSSFLCGAFVPAEFLSNSVLKIAHFLPTYYYINNNDMLKKIEVINYENLEPLIGNWLMLILFAVLFIIITNFITKKKRKLA